MNQLFFKGLAFNCASPSPFEGKIYSFFFEVRLKDLITNHQISAARIFGKIPRFVASFTSWLRAIFPLVPFFPQSQNFKTYHSSHGRKLAKNSSNNKKTLGSPFSLVWHTAYIVATEPNLRLY